MRVNTCESQDLEFQDFAARSWILKILAGEINGIYCMRYHHDFKAMKPNSCVWRIACSAYHIKMFHWNITKTKWSWFTCDKVHAVSSTREFATKIRSSVHMGFLLCQKILKQNWLAPLKRNMLSIYWFTFGWQLHVVYLISYILLKFFLCIY